MRTARSATFFCVLAAAASAAAEIRTVTSENFIVIAPNRNDSQAVLKRAEQLRVELARFWLNEELKPGQGPAIITVVYRDDLDKGVIFPINSKSRSHHMIVLQTSRELALGTTLAHEMTHVVLLNGFGNKLPAWANEGAAALQDDQERLAIRKRLLRRFAASGTWPDIRDVLEAKAISPDNQQSYTVAASLAEYLLTRGERESFLQFAAAGAGEGWDTALRRHYGITGVKSLAAEWRAWAEQSTRLTALPATRVGNRR